MAKLNVLFLTYCYPPQKYPRSIQISHLVQYLRKNISLNVVTSQSRTNGDLSLLNFTPLDNVLVAQKSCLTKWVEMSKGDCIKKALLPDFQYLWHFDLLKKVCPLIIQTNIDTIVTFGQPMSTHIAGLKLKKKYPHLKWVAHFSDPWVENLFNDYNFWKKFINTSYQNAVFNQADQLIFTSQETLNVSTDTYNENIRMKSVVLPHVFNPSLYKEKNNLPLCEKYILRYLGNFYGLRQPHGLFQALRCLPQDQYNRLRIELIGSATIDLDKLIKNYQLETVVFTTPEVSYEDSLRLMQTADLLLIIDAPTQISPFLPSKLIDYIGANKPIFGITPSGTSQKLIEEMGYLVAHPDNSQEIAAQLGQMLNQLKSGEYSTIAPIIRQRYTVDTVGTQLENILN